MARYAMVHSQFHYVANVVEWDGNPDTWKPPAGHEMVEDAEARAGPGYTYENGQFVPPPSGDTLPA